MNNVKEKRKRGGQPGNVNALKHGMYCGQKDRLGGKSPGAQPGNLNALKHGRHSRQIQEWREADPEVKALMAESLGMEIAELREKALRLLEMSEETDSLKEMASFLGAIGMAAAWIGARERVRALIARLV